MNIIRDDLNSKIKRSGMEFNLVVCGGTFDHFHKGHERFLRSILSIGNKVILGLTTDKYVQNKKLSNSVETYEKRKNSIEVFFRKENALDRLKIEPIDNLFIPKKWEKLSIDAIVVSSDTKKGAEIINQDREKRGLSKLEIIIVPILYVGSNEDLSSFRIRQGEIDREGKPYINPLWLKHKLLLTEKIKRKLEKPFGVLIENLKELFNQKLPFIITVGDVTTKMFNDLSLKQNIAVVDFKVARKVVFFNIKELGFLGNETIIKVSNPAGCLTPDIFAGAQNALRQEPKDRVIIKIEGEEDLSVLPLILASPLGTSIYYGQPREGAVKIEVSEEIKKIAYGLVDRFEY